MFNPIVTLVFAGFSAAHSAVWSLNIDGNQYPARDARFDGKLGAKRIEWSFKDNKGFPWQATTDMKDQAIACGIDAKSGALKAVARAGSDVAVQWSGIIKMHQGPVLSYLAPLPTPNANATTLEFFKIAEAGYDAQEKKWANEHLIEKGFKDTFKIPSDIKPGTYVLKTELLALHGNSAILPASMSGPQFYTHCFTIDITGQGTATPAGVKFPGGYKQEEPGVAFPLFALGGKPNTWERYIIPGPPLYKAKYEAPVGPAPVVSDKDRGLFPPVFQAKYDDYKRRQDEHATNANSFFNKDNGKINGNLMEVATFLKSNFEKYQKLGAELDDLKKEAIRLGVAGEPN